jgi:hypothetical protein
MCNLYSELKGQAAILTTAEEIDLWMNAPISEGIGLQRPLPDGAVGIVRSGVQEDALQS